MKQVENATFSEFLCWGFPALLGEKDEQRGPENKYYESWWPSLFVQETLPCQLVSNRKQPGEQINVYCDLWFYCGPHPRVHGRRAQIGAQCCVIDVGSVAWSFGAHIYEPWMKQSSPISCKNNVKAPCMDQLELKRLPRKEMHTWFIFRCLPLMID